MNASHGWKNSALLFFFSAALALGPLASAAEPVRISIDLKAAPLADALKQLQQSSGLRLAFSDDLVNSAEPVTLSVKDEPVDDVLRKILRPRGLECVYTGEKMAAIVPQASEAGMAKAAGRALRMFARLAKKLEGAVQEGDEVKVPDWTDADDRALAEGIVDLAGASCFFGQRRREGGIRPSDIARLLASYDKDLRVGACCPATEIGGQPTLPPEELAALEAAVLEALDNPDSEIRAAGVFVVALVQRPYGEKWLLVTQKVVDICSKDASPEPRFAAVIAQAAASRPTESLQKLIPTLRADANPSVRAIAWALWLSRQRRDPGPELLAEYRQAMLAEKNPILKSFGVLFLLAMLDRNPEAMVQLCSAPEVQGDPWLKISADLALSIAERMRAAREAAQAGLGNKGATPQPAPPGERNAATAAADAAAKANQQLLDTTISLMTSGKRSHQLLASVCGLYGVRVAYRPGAKTPKPDLSKIAAMADSADLWERFLGILASASLEGEAANARLLKALQSPDELDRLVALLACTMARPSSTADGAGAESDLSKKLTDVMLALVKSPIPPEKMLAAEAIGKRVPFDRLAAMMQDEVRRDPNGNLAKMLVQVLLSSPAISGLIPSGDTNQQRMMLVDVLLESKNAGLQMLFVQQATGWWFDRNKPLLLTLICECEPDVLCSVLGNTNMYPLRNDESMIRAVLERVKGLSEQNDPIARLAAVRCLAAFVNDLYRSLPPDGELKKNARELAGKMVDSCTKQGADAGSLAAGCDLLYGILWAAAGGKWEDLLPGIRAATLRAIGAIDDPIAGAKAAAVLAQCYRAGALADPDAAAAVEVARRKLMAADRPGDQIVVLCGMKTSYSMEIIAPAAAELQKRFLAGTVPAANRFEAMSALGDGRIKLSDAFAHYALARLADAEEDGDFRRAAAGSLTGQPAFYPELIDVLGELSKTPGSEWVYLPWLGDLGLGIRRHLDDLGKQNQPAPAWAAKAAEIGRTVMNNGLLQPNRVPVGGRERNNGMVLYARAAGPAASADLQRIALDTKAEIETRGLAVSLAVETNPEGKILLALAEHYAELPKDLRRSLGQTAVKARAAPGSEALLILFIKDKELGSQRAPTIDSIRPPATPALIAALKEIEQDPDIRGFVKLALHELQNQ